MIARSAKLIFLTDVTILASTMISSLVGARALGPAGRGDLLVVVLWPPVIAMLAGLGLHSTAHPFGTGEFIAADPRGLTEVPGVWVAANITGITAQVVSSAAGGVVAAAAINADCRHPPRNTVALPRSGRISR